MPSPFVTRWQKTIRDTPTLKGRDKNVAHTLALYMNKTGAAWPSKRTLAEAAGVDQSRGLEIALHALEQHGLLEITRTRGGRDATTGRGLTNTYQATQPPATNACTPHPHDHLTHHPTHPKNPPQPTHLTKNKTLKAKTTTCLPPAANQQTTSAPREERMPSDTSSTMVSTSVDARPKTDSADIQFRVRALTEMLERVDELTTPSITNGGVPSNDRGVMLPPHDPSCRFIQPRGHGDCTCWRRCIRELERLLYQLQFNDQPAFRAIRLRYIQAERVTRRDVKYRGGRFELPSNEHVVAMPAGWTIALADARNRGKAFTVDVVTVQRWNPAVSLKDVQRGLEQLAADWSQPFEPYLPVVKAAA